MGELWFVGAGLGDEQDLSRRALAALLSCDAVFAEEYTSHLARDSLRRLEQEIHRPIVRLDRARTESGAEILEALKGDRRVALLVAGDPFAATTHVALRLDAEAAGHRWTYLPGASILTAAASFLGLMHYRFGRTVSLPFPAPGFRPASPLEAIARNRTAGLHSLVLLDLDPSRDAFLGPREALDLLVQPASGLGAAAPVAVVARVGRPDVAAWYASVERLVTVDFGPPLHCVVVPAPELHFQEAAAMRRFAVA